MVLYTSTRKNNRAVYILVITLANHKEHRKSSKLEAKTCSDKLNVHLGFAFTSEWPRNGRCHLAW